MSPGIIGRSSGAWFRYTGVEPLQQTAVRGARSGLESDLTVGAARDPTGRSVKGDLLTQSAGPGTSFSAHIVMGGSPDPGPCAMPFIGSVYEEQTYCHEGKPEYQ